MAETRRLLGDLYGLRGTWKGGQVVDHLVVGTTFTLDTNADGKPCLFAHGREYVLDRGLLWDARQKSQLIQKD